MKPISIGFIVGLTKFNCDWVTLAIEEVITFCITSAVNVQGAADVVNYL